MLFLTEDFYDSALIGTATKFDTVVAAYDIELLTQVLMNQGMSELEALEYMDYNILRAYMGNNTPIYIRFVKY